MSNDTLNRRAIDVTVELTREYCSTCGIQFAMPTLYRNERLQNHRLRFHCPNGHPLIFTGQTEAERLRAELDSARQYNADTREDLARERKQHAATKGKLTKTIKRAAAGVCPFCTRTFLNVQRHVENQHGAEAANDGK